MKHFLDWLYKIQDVLDEVDGRFSFIGPAPSFLYAALKGNRLDKKLHAEVLLDLRRVRNFVSQKFGVVHTLYAHQAGFLPISRDSSHAEWQPGHAAV